MYSKTQVWVSVFTRQYWLSMHPCVWAWCVSMRRHDIRIFPRSWPSVRGIHWSPVNSPYKGPVTRRTFTVSLIHAWTKGWTNSVVTADLRWRHDAHLTSLLWFRVSFAKMLDWHYIWASRYKMCFRNPHQAHFVTGCLYVMSIQHLWPFRQRQFFYFHIWQVSSLLSRIECCQI